jgi:bifunctional non-homologous end joining protein LigD
MSLKEYWRKRNFTRTAEPQGRVQQGGLKPLRFVVQKHAASHLHFDFRLEMAGVLKSWAVPKGPSLDPAVKRLAREVEDHPVDYIDFEGVIPQGEYGGGSVMVWDQGLWLPAGGDPVAELEHGALKFVLRGKRLKGGWALVRMGGERNARNWLLIKERDSYARPGSDNALVEDNQRSVVTRRKMETIAAAGDRVWHSTGETKPARGKATRAVATRPRKRRVRA